MEYQKIANLLENALNQPTKFRTKNWVEVNAGSHGMYNTGNQIKLIYVKAKFMWLWWNVHVW